MRFAIRIWLKEWLCGLVGHGSLTLFPNVDEVGASHSMCLCCGKQWADQ